MAAAEITVQESASVGQILALGAFHADGNFFTNTGNEMLLVANDSGAPLVITVVTEETIDGLAVQDRAITVADGDTQLIGPFSKKTYNDEDGLVNLTTDAQADITVALIKKG